MLNEIVDGIQPSEVVFSKIKFWVRAWDVPLHKRTTAMAKTLATSMGDLLEVDESDPIGWCKFLRFRVALDINKPLKRWAKVATNNGPKLIKFTYEKLMDFCHACGCLGHVLPMLEI